MAIHHGFSPRTGALVFLLALCTWTPYAYADVIELQGSAVFWKRTVCPSGLECQVPQPLTAPVSISFRFDRPLTGGATLVADQIFSVNSWSVEISLIWVNPPPPSPSYLVTQLHLSEKELGVIAECSRYDDITHLEFLMPESCSGRNGSWMYGVSLLSTK